MNSPQPYAQPQNGGDGYGMPHGSDRLLSGGAFSFAAFVPISGLSLINTRFSESPEINPIAGATCKMRRRSPSASGVIGAELGRFLPETCWLGFAPASPFPFSETLLRNPSARTGASVSSRRRPARRAFSNTRSITVPMSLKPPLSSVLVSLLIPTGGKL